MNRYPLWKYIVIVVALVIGLVYTPAELLRRVSCSAGLVRQGDGEGERTQTLKTVEDLLRNADRIPTASSSNRRPAEHRARTLRAD